GGVGAPRAGALGVIGNAIAALGSDAVNARIGKRTRVVDLGGAFVMPGVIDTHTHFLLGSRTLSQPDLRTADTRAEFARRIGEAARAAKPGHWIEGGGWDHELWGG